MIPVKPNAGAPIAAQETIPVRPNASEKISQKNDKAAGQFESLMALQMVKEMTKSIEHSPLFGGMPGSHVYSGLADWQLAEMLSRNAHLGLKEAILRQIESKEKLPDDPNIR